MVQVPPTQPEERSTDGPAAARAAAMTALGGADFESAYETGAVLDQTSVFGLEWTFTACQLRPHSFMRDTGISFGEG